MENTTLVYMTFPTKADAIAVGRELVGHKLAACVNILDQMNSIYHWDGELQYDTEVVMIAKTLASRVPELTEIVKANHSAECPCILTIPVTGGNPDFLAWIAGEVQK
jgi:periplasmic divalent cation tolerance protein